MSSKSSGYSQRINYESEHQLKWDQKLAQIIWSNWHINYEAEFRFSRILSSCTRVTLLWVIIKYAWHGMAAAKTSREKCTRYSNDSSSIIQSIRLTVAMKLEVANIEKVHWNSAKNLHLAKCRADHLPPFGATFDSLDMANAPKVRTIVRFHESTLHCLLILLGTSATKMLSNSTNTDHVEINHRLLPQIALHYLHSITIVI